MLTATRYYGLELPRHRETHAYLSLLLEGSYRQCWQRQWRQFRPGTLSFHPAGEIHRDVFPPSGAFCLRIELLPSRSRPLPPHWLSRPFLANLPAGRRVARQMVRELNRPDRFASWMIEALILELLLLRWRSNRQPRPLPSWLPRTWDLLRARYAEPLSVRQLAAAAGVHPSHLAREFRRHYACTVGEAVRRLRVEHACAALDRGGRPSLAQLALECGFSDQSQFCRNFRAVAGLSPGAYARRAAASPAPVPAPADATI